MPKRILVLIMFVVVIALALPLATSIVRPQSAYAAGQVRASTSNPHPLCSKIGTTIWASTALRMWCNPPQPASSSHLQLPVTARAFGSNVNAADPAEDVSPSGVRGYGQSETSIAAVGPYVVEAWNDVTGLALNLPCPSPMNKQEGTGYGFSADRGASFVDEGGLPNAACTHFKLSGDPSVEAWMSGGSTYFYVSSLYFPNFSASGPPPDTRALIAINTCKASGAGTGATITCSQPVIAAASTQCQVFKGGSFCSFLDKEYLSIDPRHGRLYVSYTEFGIKPPPDNLAFGQIELAVCDIGTPGGGTGLLGGTAGSPVCKPGGTGTPDHPSSPYFVVAPGPKCANQGSYPAVDVATGDVYIAYEFNLGTDVFVAGCNSIPTQNVVARAPFSCLTLPISSCKGPATRNAVNVVTMFATVIPGYSRFPLQDFPRVAVSDPAGTVSIVWNDAGAQPLGDILLQSFTLGGLTPLQQAPVRLNRHVGGLHFLPALRNANADGSLNISWYERSSPTTTLTNVVAALSVNPLTTSTPASNTLVTSAATDWLKVTAFPFFPNFGDYTDNYVPASAEDADSGSNLFVAWSDGRTGVPQPFAARR